MNFICKRYINKEKILRLNKKKKKLCARHFSSVCDYNLCVEPKRDEENKKNKQTNNNRVISYSSNDSIAIHTETLPATNTVLAFKPENFSSVKLCTSKQKFILNTDYLAKSIDAILNKQMESK